MLVKYNNNIIYFDSCSYKLMSVVILCTIDCENYVKLVLSDLDEVIANPQLLEAQVSHSLLVKVICLDKIITTNM